MSHSFQVTFDALDPPSLAEFWCLALEYVIQPPPPEFESWDDWARAMEIPESEWDRARALVDPEGRGPRVFLQKVPEGKAAKNRVHLDINAGGGHSVEREVRISAVEAHVDALLDAGARFVERFDTEQGYWVVMQDPEGNEFCVQ